MDPVFCIHSVICVLFWGKLSSLILRFIKDQWFLIPGIDIRSCLYWICVLWLQLPLYILGKCGGCEVSGIEGFFEFVSDT